ncbi:MAG: GntR family transcriptional regulator [Actinomycetia bacterium]|nr:GntR family transcriptional regulator [Actinomycetes bacterium]
MPGGRGFVYLDIAEAVRRLIVSGEVRPGERLPSVRAMARRWDCTPNTVSRAYSVLIDEGLVSAHRGGGTRVTSPSADLERARPPEWRWAELVNRAEGYLLEALNQGHSPAHAEAALAAAIARWEEMRRRPAPRVPSSAAGAAAEEAGRPPRVRFSGSHDLAVELLSRSLSEQEPAVELTTDFVGSLGGLIAVARGEADIAGSHLWDEVTGTYNVPFVQRVLPNRRIVLLGLAHRVQGLIVPPGNPQGLSVISDLTRPGVTFINRQPGSGTRVWLDVTLKGAGVAPENIAGYEQEEPTHLGVARAVAEGRATAGLGISAAATAYGLGFVPVGKERYDLIVPLEVWDLPPLRTLRSVVASPAFRDAVAALGGYDVAEMGTEHTLA